MQARSWNLRGKLLLIRKSHKCFSENVNFIPQICSTVAKCIWKASTHLRDLIVSCHFDVIIQNTCDLVHFCIDYSWNWEPKCIDVKNSRIRAYDLLLIWFTAKKPGDRVFLASQSDHRAGNWVVPPFGKNGRRDFDLSLLCQYKDHTLDIIVSVVKFQFLRKNLKTCRFFSRFRRFWT